MYCENCGAVMHKVVLFNGRVVWRCDCGNEIETPDLEQACYEE